ncbi:MAG TPA: orotate phosphoribosyltransferase [Firmicutes bacterium]|nr:orotate phosphoribosyltransferase [Bacillota bacterium]
MNQSKFTYEQLGAEIYNISRITGTFQLRSGATSTVYFDKYRFESDPSVLQSIAEHLAKLIPEGTDRLIGLEMGGIPLATATGLLTGTKLGFCRKKAKEYGTMLQVEGGIEKGEKITIIEDVVTSGGAAVDAINALRESGCEILALVCVIDREAGAGEKFQSMGVDFRALFTWSILDKIAGKNKNH